MFQIAITAMIHWKSYRYILYSIILYKYILDCWNSILNELKKKNKRIVSEICMHREFSSSKIISNFQNRFTASKHGFHVCCFFFCFSFHSHHVNEEEKNVVIWWCSQNFSLVWRNINVFHIHTYIWIVLYFFFFILSNHEYIFEILIWILTFSIIIHFSQVSSQFCSNTYWKHFLIFFISFIFRCCYCIAIQLFNFSTVFTIKMQIKLTYIYVK